MSIISTHLNEIESIYETSTNVLKAVSDIFMSDKEFTLIHVSKNGIVDSQDSENYIKGSYTLSDFTTDNTDDNDSTKYTINKATIETDESLEHLETEFSSGKFILKYEISTTSDGLNNIYEEKEVTIKDIRTEIDSVTSDEIIIITFNEEAIFKTKSNIEMRQEKVVGNYLESSSYTYLNNRISLHGGKMDLGDIVYYTTSNITSGELKIYTGLSSNDREELIYYLTGVESPMPTTSYTIDSPRIKIRLQNTTTLVETFIYPSEIAKGDGTSDITFKLDIETSSNSEFILSNSDVYDVQVFKLLEESIIPSLYEYLLYIKNNSLGTEYRYPVYNIRTYTKTIGVNTIIDMVDFTLKSDISNYVDNSIIPVGETGAGLPYFEIGLYSKYTNHDRISENLSDITERFDIGTIPEIVFGVFDKYVGVNTDIDDGKINLYKNPRDNKNFVNTAANTGSFYYKTIDEEGGSFYSLPTQALFGQYNNSSDVLLNLSYDQSTNTSKIILNKDVLIPVLVKINDVEYTKFYLFNKVASEIEMDVSEDGNYIVSAYVYYFSNYESSGFKLGIKVRPVVENYSIKYPNETIIGGFNAQDTLTDPYSLWDINNMPDIDIDYMMNELVDFPSLYWKKLPNLNKYYMLSENDYTGRKYIKATMEELIFMMQNKANIEDGLIDFGKIFLYQIQSDYYYMETSTTEPLYSITNDIKDETTNIMYMIDGK